MADVLFVRPDGNGGKGSPYPLSSAPNITQKAPQTVLNHHPTVIEIQFGPGENQIAGELWIRNSNNTDVMVGEFDKTEGDGNNSPTTFSNGNNMVFIQSGDVLQAEIQEINNSSLSQGNYIIRTLETKRLQLSDLGSNLDKEVSAARLANEVLVLELSNQTNLFNFYNDLPTIINLGPHTPENTNNSEDGYGTTPNEQTVSYARKVQGLKNYLSF